MNTKSITNRLERKKAKRTTPRGSMKRKVKKMARGQAKR